jgi:hypothetical protein
MILTSLINELLILHINIEEQSMDRYEILWKTIPLQYYWISAWEAPFIINCACSVFPGSHLKNVRVVGSDNVPLAPRTVISMI